MAKKNLKTVDEEKLLLGYKYVTDNKWNEAIEIFEALLEAQSEYVTRKMLLTLAEIYGALGKVVEEVTTYSKLLNIDNKKSEYEDAANYGESFEQGIKNKLINYTEQFITYFNTAVSSYNNREYLKALAYIDVCWNTNKLKSIEVIRNTYKQAYLAHIDALTHEDDKITVYAICQNERGFIERWMHSVKDADYICIFDTGSSDGTYEKFVELSKTDKRIIVKRSEIIPFRFDLARNAAMRLVPDDSNILISLDLNEVISENWIKELKETWKTNISKQAKYKYVWSRLSSDSDGKVFFANRIHTKKLIWRYPIKESLYDLETDSEVTEEEKIVTLAETKIYRYPDAEKVKTNHFNLYELRVKENINDYPGVFYFADELRKAERYKESNDLLNYLLSNSEIHLDNSLYAACYICGGKNYEAMENYQDALLCYQKILEVEPNNREGNLSIAKILLADSQPDKATEFIKLALRESVRKYSELEDELAWTYLPYKLLSLAYYYTGDKVRAYACAIQAAQIEPAESHLSDNVFNIWDTLVEQDWGM